MGVLKAKVGGAWVPVVGAGGGGPDEVWVGPADPFPTLNPEAELWFDTDASDSALQDVQRWNSAWGAVAAPVQSITPGNSSTSGWAAVPGLSITFTAVAGRRYAMTATVSFRQGVTASLGAYLMFRDTAGPTDLYYTLNNLPSSNQGYHAITIRFTASNLAAGPKTIQVFGQTISNAVNWNDYGGSTFVIEDVGPVNATVAPVQNPTPAWINVSTFGFQNSWVDFDTERRGRIRKVGDMVYLDGVLKSGTVNSVAFTVPAEYRPPLGASAPRAFWTVGPGSAPNNIAGVNIYGDGRVLLAPPTNAYCYLDGCFWSTT